MAKKKKHIDYFLLVITAFFILLGLMILAEVSAIRSQEVAGNSTRYLFHQILYGLLPGVILGLIVFKMGLERIRKASFFLVLGNLLLMFLVFIPGLGFSAGGAARWLNLHFFALQPAEFLKLTTIIYLAAWLASRTGSKQKKPTLLPFIVIMGLITLALGIQSDLSTWGVIFGSALVVYFLSETPLWHSAIFFSSGAAATIILIKYAGYRISRLAIFLGSKKDPMGLGYHIKQALIAVGSGGIFGVGLGASQQKYGFLPKAMSDSIFAVFAEEVGFVGSVLLVAAFILFFWRVFVIARKNKDNFNKLLVMGVGTWICLQAFINIGAMIRLVPLTGIPLPFITLGGSHILVELVAVSLVLKVSKS